MRTTSAPAGARLHDDRGRVDVVLLTAIATLSAFLYNMSASLLGGIEVTLAEDK